MPTAETVNVLITHYFPDTLIDPLRQISSRLNIRHIPSKDAAALDDVWPEIEVLYTTTVLPTPEQAPKLRWVQGHFAGVEHLHDHPIAAQVQLTNVSGIHTTALGEYVLGMMIALAHRLPRMMYYQRRNEWPKGRWEKFVPTELRGATVGIVGYGSLGREIGRLARAFGMSVLAVKRDPARLVDEGWRMAGTGDAEGMLPDRIYPPQALRTMLPECDYLVLTVPLTPTTRHMIGASELAALKPGAILINVARGNVVDEAALVKALKDGALGGAILDVFEAEPLPADSPLWQFDNVILSPHVAGFTPHYDERALQVFAENLRRYLVGEPLINLVDVAKGY